MDDVGYADDVIANDKYEYLELYMWLICKRVWYQVHF